LRTHAAPIDTVDQNNAVQTGGIKHTRDVVRRACAAAVDLSSIEVSHQKLMPWDRCGKLRDARSICSRIEQEVTCLL
jgi:hypothetical protein